MSDLLQLQKPDSEMGDAGLLPNTLWKDVEHPAISSLGEPYKYRSPDGSNNNVQQPHLGKSGSYYARAVTPMHVPTRVPDPEKLFDALLARKDKPTPHPTGISSLFFALAAIIVDDVFRTSDEDKDKVATSSYLDLSSLYGTSEETQSSIRTFADGRLKPDAFAETRILSRPAESCVLLLCFARFHNSIAEQLAIINENDRFSLPSNIARLDTASYEKAVAKRDNDLFQTARLVTNGLYINMILNDYVQTILNLQRMDAVRNLYPGASIRKTLGQHDADNISGNQTSVEFNLIYRWHSTISAKAEGWLNDHMAKMCPNTKIEDLTIEALRAGIRKFAGLPPADPGRRRFADLRRNAEGYFDDADLVRILTESTDQVAMGFGPRHVPIALKVIEVMSMKQAREWGVATLNETRSFLRMAPYTSFTDVNSDPDIATALEALYGEVDNIELYVGAIVEEPQVPETPGSGLCAGPTTTRAVLSHALALVRGDRFYTNDYNPLHLTAFGYKKVSSDPSIAGGGVMYRLLLSVFPEVR